MKNQTFRFYAVLFIIGLILALVAIGVISPVETIQVNPSLKVDKNLDCQSVSYEELAPVYENVTEQREIWGTCQVFSVENQTNQPKPCITANETYIVTIQTGYQNVTKQRQECAEDSYTITANSITEDIIYKQFGRCSYQNITDGIVITCDSKYDGNGDGKCQSGESCCSYTVTSAGIQSNCDLDSAFVEQSKPLEVRK
ncbi:hypothetical protein HYV81_06010 [Candidatus Woesearchaeota archaeon]|nr:hypothetical protein [Candidatus Woesearchaeota archaeon]